MILIDEILTKKRKEKNIFFLSFQMNLKGYGDVFIGKNKTWGKRCI